MAYSYNFILLSDGNPIENFPLEPQRWKCLPPEEEKVKCEIKLRKK